MRLEERKATEALVRCEAPARVDTGKSGGLIKGKSYKKVNVLIDI